MRVINSASEYMYFSQSHIKCDNPEDGYKSQEYTASMDTWLEILKLYSFEYVKYNVLLNEKPSIEIIDILSKDPSLYTRSRVAAARYLKDRSIFERLSSDKHKSVRQDIASHPNIPIDLLEKLAHDRSLSVR